MAKSAGPGRCVHCLKIVGQRNWDHVFPESWYPDTTPPNIEKWKAPSCIPCNSAHGRSEEELLIKIGLCLDPNDSDAKAITAKVRRALNPRYAKSEKDALIRGRSRERILRESKVFFGIPQRGLMPNFGPKPTYSQRHRGIYIGKSSLNRLVEKIVRGIVFIESSLYIDSSYEIEMHVLHDTNAQPIMEVIKQHGVEISRGPGIKIMKATLEEDPRCGLYAIEIWSRLKLYASVVNRES